MRISKVKEQNMKREFEQAFKAKDKNKVFIKGALSMKKVVKHYHLLKRALNKMW